MSYHLRIAFTFLLLLFSNQKSLANTFNQCSSFLGVKESNLTEHLYLEVVITALESGILSVEEIENLIRAKKPTLPFYSNSVETLPYQKLLSQIHLDRLDWRLVQKELEELLKQKLIDNQYSTEDKDETAEHRHLIPVLREKPDTFDFMNFFEVDGPNGPVYYFISRSWYTDTLQFVDRNGIPNEYVFNVKGVISPPVFFNLDGNNYIAIHVSVSTGRYHRLKIFKFERNKPIVVTDIGLSITLKNPPVYSYSDVYFGPTSPLIVSYKDGLPIISYESIHQKRTVRCQVKIDKDLKARFKRTYGDSRLNRKIKPQNSEDTSSNLIVESYDNRVGVYDTQSDSIEYIETGHSVKELRFIGDQIFYSHDNVNYVAFLALKRKQKQPLTLGLWILDLNRREWSVRHLEISYEEGRFVYYDDSDNWIQKNKKHPSIQLIPGNRPKALVRILTRGYRGESPKFTLVAIDLLDLVEGIPIEIPEEELSLPIFYEKNDKSFFLTIGSKALETGITQSQQGQKKYPVYRFKIRNEPH